MLAAGRADASQSPKFVAVFAWWPVTVGVREASTHQTLYLAGHGWSTPPYRKGRATCGQFMWWEPLSLPMTHQRPMPRLGG